MASVILDIVGSFILGGMLLMMGIKLNIYTSNYHQQSTFDLNAQRNCVQLGTIIENDFVKIGYGDKSGLPVRTADSSTIKFYADIDNNGSLDSVSYYPGAMIASYYRGNPHHKLMYRKVNTAPAIAMNLGVTKFKLTYYDSSGVKTAALNKIRAISIDMSVESDFRSVTAGKQDTVFNTIHWKQYVVPKALHF